MNRTEEGEIIHIPINDPRLKPGMRRMRAGHSQMFGERIIRGPDQQECEFEIEPPKKSWYALEVNGVWMWVEGCDVCNGKWKDYVYMRCEHHDRCFTCGCTRQDAVTNNNGAVWGMRGGWQCESCHEADRRTQLTEAEARIAERDEEGETECNMADKPTCPWCGSTGEAEGEDYGADGEDRECYSCNRSYSLTAVHLVYWDSKRNED